MKRSDPRTEIVEFILEALRSRGLEPKLIPYGRTDELRGGLSSFELDSAEGVDAAILYSRMSYDSVPKDSFKALYKLDYAVRGNIRGVLPGRILARTTIELKGLLRKRLVGLRWEIPLGDSERAPRYLYRRVEGKPPGSGELWEGGHIRN